MPDVSPSTREDLARFRFNFFAGIGRRPVCNHLQLVQLVPRINSLILNIG